MGNQLNPSPKSNQLTVKTYHLSSVTSVTKVIPADSGPVVEESVNTHTDVATLPAA